MHSENLLLDILSSVILAPSPPVNIAAKTVNSTAIKVTWQAPLYPNGEIYYRLYYWLSSEGVGTKRLAYDGPLLGHTVAGLHEYVTYTFTLQAYNVKYFWNSTATSATETTHPSGESFIVYNSRFFLGQRHRQSFFFLTRVYLCDKLALKKDAYLSLFKL